MNTISKVTDAISHPVQTTGSVVSQTWGLAGAVMKAPVRVIGWVMSQSPVSQSHVSQGDSELDEMAPARQEPATTSPAKKPPARKAPARKAPSAKAATAGPALAQPDPVADLGVGVGAGASGLVDSPDVPEAGIVETDGAAEPLEPAEPAPDAEPLLDPSVAKAIRTESHVMERASDPDKG